MLSDGDIGISSFRSSEIHKIIIYVSESGFHRKFVASTEFVHKHKLWQHRPVGKTTHSSAPKVQEAPEQKS